MKCINPKCETEAIARGLCKACYYAVKKWVTNGVTTWEKLEAEGKSIPTHKGHTEISEQRRRYFIGDDDEE